MSGNDDDDFRTGGGYDQQDDSTPQGSQTFSSGVVIAGNEDEDMIAEQADDTAVPSLPTRFPRAVELQPLDASPKLYWDRSHYESPEAQVRALHASKTVYVGNLSFSTRASHIFGFFSSIGPVKAVNMGLDRLRKTPCGFCFVEFWKRSDALASVQYGSGSRLDGSVIRVELDAGFQPGRQYGRGRKGGQVRDDKRETGRQPGFRGDGGASAAGSKRSIDEALAAPRSGGRRDDRGDVQQHDASAEPDDEDDGEQRAAKRQRAF
jgi:nuclear cap-binding protein subunit 2